MKPHPRIRKTIKWGGAVVTVLLVVVWIGSGWWFVEWWSQGAWRVGVVSGVLQLVYSQPPPDGLEGWHARSAPSEFLIGFNGEFTPQTSWVQLPLWVPTLLALLSCVIAWRLDTLARRRERAHHCPKCNYDRTGLAIGAVCPECGVGGAGA